MTPEEEKYFDRYGWSALLEGFDFQSDTEIVVVIPSHRETHTDKAIKSLMACPVNFKVLILVIVNESDKADKETTETNHRTLTTIRDVRPDPGFQIETVSLKFPSGKAGVGMARKAGMDQAARWFSEFSKNGIIICFDADCTCAPNYLPEILNTYQQEKNEAGIVFYEHPIDGPDIINYELYLRYYVDALRFAGYPFASQTLGSCITINSKQYIKQGGMNTRQAGEDFYFIQKIIRNTRFVEINSTTIYPSSRISDRVPFGTGKAICDLRNGKKQQLYDPRSFEWVGLLVNKISDFQKGSNNTSSEMVNEFLESQAFDDTLKKIISNSPNDATFEKHFYQWFDGFRVLKFLHFMREHYYPDVELQEGIHWLDSVYWRLGLKERSPEEQLLLIRSHNRVPFHYGWSAR